ncbi:histone-lysine N-methyltransferase SETMAR [Trichonephila clavipes]|uniref:Histone-lysine N-methyltransferase SETMAR n=1 Tax=Trichonephila clavipes TaxID=2585209 RepID=A0A8X7BBQ3_TRICX|nr:histone-lysine N-methyltransferase SETMAR [Trichonephila clavipes]
MFAVCGVPQGVKWCSGDTFAFPLAHASPVWRKMVFWGYLCVPFGPRFSRMEENGDLGVPLRSLWPTLLPYGGKWVNAGDKGWKAYPLDPHPDAVSLNSACTAGKRRTWFLPEDRHTASLVVFRSGWRHARTKLFFAPMDPLLLCPDSPFLVTPHKSLNSGREVISERDLLTTPETEILEEFSNQDVIQIGKTKRAGVWVPHNLSEENRANRSTTCNLLLQRYNTELFFDTLITADKKWVLYDNPKRERQWLSPKEPPRRTAKPGLHPKKALLCVWWGIRGIIHFEVLKPGETVNADLYCEQLDQLNQSLIEKYPAVINRKVIIVQHDNILRNQQPEKPHLTVITALIRLGIESKRDWMTFTTTNTHAASTRCYSSSTVETGVWR